MNTILRLAVLACLMAALTVGCSSTKPAENSDSGNTGASSNGQQDANMAMINAMKNQPAPMMVALPPNPAKGQWWEYSMQGGSKMKEGLVAEKDGHLILERSMDMNGKTMIWAFQVDPAAEMGKPNVKAAWIGMAGMAPEALKVMEPGETPAGGATGETPETGEETVTMAGKEFMAMWSKTGNVKSWVAKGTSFVLKSEMDGKVTMELTGWGATGAEPQLKW